MFFAAAIAGSVGTSHPLFLFTSFAAALFYLLLWGKKKALKTQFPTLLTLMLLTTFGNPLLSHNGATVLFYLNGNRMTLEALIRGFFAGLSICTVLLWFACMNLVITNDQYIYLFGRSLPVVSLTISMMLRYLPMMRRRYRKIEEVHRTLGDDPEETVFDRMRIFGRNFSTMLSWTLEDSIDTGDSMEARGYRLGRRTCFHRYVYGKKEVLRTAFLLMGCALTLSGELRPFSGMCFYPTFTLPGVPGAAYGFYIVYLMVLIFPTYLTAKEAYRWKLLLSDM